MQRTEFSINLQLLDGLIQKQLVLYCWQTYLCTTNVGPFGFQELCRQRRGEFSSFIGLKCTVSMCVLIVHPSKGMQAGLYKKMKQLVCNCGMYIFVCDYNANSQQNRWKFQQNNCSVYSLSFYCSLSSVIFCASMQKEESPAQDMNSCLPHMLGLLEAAGSHGARTPQLTQSYTGETCRPCA